MKFEHIFKTSNLGIVELILRTMVSFVMLYHGYGKLTGLEQYTALFTKIGIEPAHIMAILAGLGETLGGLSLLLGLFTRLGAFSLSICITYAFIYLGLPNGFNIVHSGYEYQLTLMPIFLFFISHISLHLALLLQCLFANYNNATNIIDLLFCPVYSQLRDTCD